MRTVSLFALCRLLIVVGLVSATISCRADDSVSAYRGRYPLPVLSVPDAQGVNIHFTDPKTGRLDQLAAAGFHWIRMDFAWSGIERVPGKYDFASYDRLMAGLNLHGIRPIFILDYGNDLYEQGPPRTPEARAAFCRFVEAALAHFRHRGVVWEMWNEPNGSGFWGGQANVEQYITLALAVGRTVRSAAPDEWLIGPAVSGMDFPYLTSCLQVGLLRYWDAVSVHPYRNTAPESAALEIERLRELIDRYAPSNKKIPIISGEWGYSELYPGLNLSLQSRYIAREFLSNLVNGVVLSIWYDWHDDGTNPKEEEHHFGTVYPDFRPKPTYDAVRTLTTTLRGFAYNKRLTLDHPDDYCLLFTHGKEVRLAVWTASTQPHEVVVPASAGSFDVIGFTGERTHLEATADGLHLTLTDAPQYLLPTGTNALLSLAVAWTALPPYIPVGKEEDYFSALLSATEAVGILARNLPDAVVKIEELNRTGTRDGQPRLLMRRQLSDDSRHPIDVIYPVIIDRSGTPHRVRARIVMKSGGSMLAQETMFLQRDPLIVTPIPTSSGKIGVRIDNPSGVRFQGRVETRSGDVTLSMPLTFQKGETHKEIAFEHNRGHDRNFSVQFRIYDGNHAGEPNDYPELVTPVYSVTSIETFQGATPGESLARCGYTLAADGDPKINSVIDGKVIEITGGAGLVSGHAAEIDYSFAPGWKFLDVNPEGARRDPLPGRPDSLGMWVNSDGSGDALRARFEDSTGQTFQPDAGNLDWKGWHYVSFSLHGDHGGWWGGAADGVIHYPIRLQTVLLVDSKEGHGGKGRVAFTDVTLVSESVEK